MLFQMCQTPLSSTSLLTNRDLRVSLFQNSLAWFLEWIRKKFPLQPFNKFSVNRNSSELRWVELELLLMFLLRSEEWWEEDDPSQHLFNLSVPTNHSGILFKYRHCSHELGAGRETPQLYPSPKRCWCCWSLWEVNVYQMAGRPFGRKSFI